MKNLRTYTLTKAAAADFDPVAFTESRRAAGFKFDRETRPVKIAGPWNCFESSNGDFIYRQWDWR